MKKSVRLSVIRCEGESSYAYWLLALYVLIKSESSQCASSTAVPKDLVNLLKNSSHYNKHASPTQDTGQLVVQLVGYGHSQTP